MAKQDYTGRTLEVLSIKRNGSLFYTAINPSEPRDKEGVEFRQKNPCKILMDFKITLGILDYGENERKRMRVKCNIDYTEWVYLVEQVKDAVHFRKFKTFHSFKCHNMVQDQQGLSPTFDITISFDPNIADHPTKTSKNPFRIIIKEGKAPTTMQSNGIKTPTSNQSETSKYFYLSEAEMISTIRQTEIAIDRYVRMKDMEFAAGYRGFMEAILKGKDANTNLQKATEQNDYVERHESEQQQYATVRAIIRSEFLDTNEGYTCECMFENQNTSWLIFNRITESLRQAREAGSPVILDILMQNGKYFAREHVA